jgi:hypothetical protein
VHGTWVIVRRFLPYGRGHNFIVSALRKRTMTKSGADAADCTAGYDPLNYDGYDSISIGAAEAVHGGDAFGTCVSWWR